MFSFSRRRFLEAIVLGASVARCGFSSDSNYRSSRSFEVENDTVERTTGKEQVFPDSYQLTLVSKYSRKTDSYTQGLLFEFDPKIGKGVLYESGGKYGASLLRKTDAVSG